MDGSASSCGSEGIGARRWTVTMFPFALILSISANNAALGEAVAVSRSWVKMSVKVAGMIGVDDGFALCEVDVLVVIVHGGLGRGGEDRLRQFGCFL